MNYLGNNILYKMRNVIVSSRAGVNGISDSLSFSASGSWQALQKPCVPERPLGLLWENLSKRARFHFSFISLVEILCCCTSSEWKPWSHISCFWSQKDSAVFLKLDLSLAEHKEVASVLLSLPVSLLTAWLVVCSPPVIKQEEWLAFSSRAENTGTLHRQIQTLWVVFRYLRDFAYHFHHCSSECCSHLSKRNLKWKGWALCFKVNHC